MANDLIRKAHISNIRSALGKAADAGQIDHPGVKGRAREIFLKDILQPIIPPYVEFGSGKIVDSQGQNSGEIDIVVYSRKTLPPLLLEEGFGIYPVEGSIYAIEVKSKLTANEINTTIEKTKRLQALKYSYQEKGDFYPLQLSSPTPVIACIFAFNTDLAANGKSEIDRYRELDPEFNISPSIKVICVAGRGYWHYWRGGASPIWVQHNPTEEQDEILDFVGGVANTIPGEILRRGGPSFGNYILKEDKTRITGVG